jgi:hypothetical protein
MQLSRYFLSLSPEDANIHFPKCCVLFGYKMMEKLRNAVIIMAVYLCQKPLDFI